MAKVHVHDEGTASPTDRRELIRRVALYVPDLACGDTRMFFRQSIKTQPEKQPYETQSAGEEKSRLPPVTAPPARAQQRRHSRSHIGSCIDKCRWLGARSFLGNHCATILMDAGKLAASPRPSSARKWQCEGRCGQSVRHRRDAPDAGSRSQNPCATRSVQQPAHARKPTAYAGEGAVMLLYSILFQPMVVSSVFARG